MVIKRYHTREIAVCPEGMCREIIPRQGKEGSVKHLLLALVISFNLFAGQNKPATNSPLVNQEGKPFQLYDLKGKFVFLSFIYTRCPLPNMCPLTVTLNKSLYQAWKKQKGAPELHFLFVTLDPKFDTPAVLKAFAKSRNLDLKHFTLATGSPEALSSMAAEFQTLAVPEGGFIAHNMTNTLLDPKLMVVRSYAENQWKPEQVLKEMTSTRDLAAAPPEKEP